MVRRLILLFAFASALSAETITDTIRDASGTAIEATISICWTASYINTGGQPKPANCLDDIETSSGVFSVVLDANDTNTPSGTSYAVSFRFGTGQTTTQTWVVPTSGSSQGITDVFSATTPTPSATINVSLIAAGTNTVNIVWTGVHDFSAGQLELPNSTAPISTDCDEAAEAGRIHVDTDATSGQQLFACEGLAGWVLQGDGGGGSGITCASTPTELTLDGAGAITLVGSKCYTLDTFADASSDALVTINCNAGDRFIFRPAADSRTVTVTHDGAAIRIRADFIMDNADDIFEGWCTGTNVIVATGRHSNGS